MKTWFIAQKKCSCTKQKEDGPFVFPAIWSCAQAVEVVDEETAGVTVETLPRKSWEGGGGGGGVMTCTATRHQGAIQMLWFVFQEAVNSLIHNFSQEVVNPV